MESDRSHVMKIKTNAGKVSLFILSAAALLAGGATTMPAQLAMASDQSDQRGPLATEKHEKYDNPPAPSPMWATAVSPAMISQAGPFISYQVNIDANGNNIVGDAANEPSIAVDPTNGNKMVIGWRQFDSVTSNFRTSGRGYTTNGGISWTFPGVLENNVFGSDPVLLSDETGRFFYLSLFIGQMMNTDIWRSIDGGQSWANKAFATGGDKEWFTIDTSNSIGHGLQYQYWSPNGGSTYGDRQFSRSTDGGFTWMDPIRIPNSPQTGTLDVDSDGNLFLGGFTAYTDQMWCIRSTNAKKRTATPRFDQSTAINLGGKMLLGTAINPGGLAGQIFVAADRSGTTTNNSIYILASVQPPSDTGSDVMFIRSTDHGASFSSPRRINDDPVNHTSWHWFGTLSVAPNGRIDAVWLDTRNAANNRDSQLFYSYSKDGGQTWSPNVAASNSFDPSLGYPNQNKMGDYITMVSDNAGGNVAYTATFNGEEDIYYVRVVPTPFPDYSLSISPLSLGVPRAGGIVNYVVTIAPKDGFSEPVTLTATGFPSGVTWNFNPNPATTSSTLNVTVNSSTLSGSYPVTVTGTGGTPALTRSATATLVKAKK
jgi:hypothetical protein